MPLPLPPSANPAPIEFGEFACADALGVTLAHTLIAGALKFKKGHRLAGVDLLALQQAGIASVTGARLQAGDASEDEAAALLANALTGPHIEARNAYTGRCNLHAICRGLLLVETDAIHALNRIDEALTVATLPPHAVVRAGQVLATVKTIPFGVPAGLMARYRRELAALPAAPLRVAEFQPRRAALIFTELPQQRSATPNAVNTTRAATRQRLEAFGSRLALELHCPHEPAAVAATLRQAQAAGCDLSLVSGATVTADRLDVVPAAICAAGGRIERYGMPVEPGNMLVLATLDATPVLVLPGCARTRRLNGLDWVLQRLHAGLPLDAECIAQLGVGGLIRSTLEEAEPPVATGQAPEITAQNSLAKPATTPRIAALILAAGRSSRMGASNKLLEPVAGVPLILRAVNAARASRAASVTVVTGNAAADIDALLAATPVERVHNPEFASGMASSLRCGVAALPADSDAVLVMLADMPQINATHLDTLMAAFAANPQITVPLHAGRRGNPVLWPRSDFAALQGLSGDQGARELLKQFAARTHCVEMPDAAIFADIDTPQALAEQRRMLEQNPPDSIHQA